MTWRQLPNAENLSEFVPEPDGTVEHARCGEDALLGGLHCLDAGRFPLTGAALDTITKTMQAHTFPDGTRWADQPGGASTMSGLAAMMDLLRVGYTRYDVGQLHNVLWDYAGIHPVLIEFADAGALPMDERGVQYHYHCCVAGDPATDTYGDVDGDSYAVRVSHGLGPLAQLTWSQIAAGQPYAVLVLDGGPMTTVPAGWTWDGTRLASPNGESCDTGMAEHIMGDASWAADDWIVRPEYSGDVFPGDTAIGEGSRLDCLYTSLGYVNHDVPSLGITAGQVFIVRTGEDITTMRDEITQLKLQLAAASAANEGPGDVLDDPANRASFRATLIEAQSSAQKLLSDITAAAASIPA